MENLEFLNRSIYQQIADDQQKNRDGKSDEKKNPLFFIEIISIADV